MEDPVRPQVIPAHPSRAIAAATRLYRGARANHPAQTPELDRAHFEADPEQRRAIDAHLGIVQDIDKGDARGVLHVIGQPVSLARTPSRLVAPPPERGQHTEEILREFGFSDAEIAGLRESKVV